GQPALPEAAVPAHQHPENAAAALLAALAFLRAGGRDPDLDALEAALRGFPGVEGRFQAVAEVNGTVFVDDSIATRTISVEAALKSARAPIAWIVGGLDKGADLAPLREAARGKVARLIAVGRDGPSLAERLGVADTTVVNEPDGWDAMRAACRAGLEAAPNGTVLLAPIGTSFDQFRDYRERGEAFAAAARELREAVA
ncbi:MAG TPA: cyanophycin synthetase, partial [Deinococcales bacterium]|nr:cyanophycin synthetase [Deinococcales bacterium]